MPAHVQPGDVPEMPSKLPDSAQSAPAAFVSGEQTFARARKVRGQFGRYVGALWWVVRDALPRWKWRVAAIVAGNFLGLAATVGAVGGVMQYARAAEHDHPLRILHFQIALGEGVRPLLLFGAAIAGLGLLAAACTYVTDRLILSLARQYQVACAHRALAIAADPLCRGWQIAGEHSPRAILARLSGGSSRVMGLMLRDLLRIILPTLTFIATVGFLFYVDSTLTLMLLPAAALYLLPLYLINRRVSRLQREYRERSSLARGEMSRRLRELLNSGRLESGVESLQREVFDGPDQRGALAALYGRLLADRRVHLLNASFFILCLVALLIFFGIQARDHARPWSDLIFYVLALRYAMTSLKQTTAMGAKFSRFFPEYSAYATFVINSRRTRIDRTSAITQSKSLPDVLTVRIGKQARWDSPRAIRIRTAQPVIILTAMSPSYADLEALALRMEQRLDEPFDLTTHAAFVAQVDAIERAPHDNLTLLVIEGSLATRPRVQQWLSARRPGELLMLAHDDVAAALELPENLRRPIGAVLICDGFRLVAGGELEWLRDHLEPITRFLHEQAESLRGRGGEDDSLDDDDDEDSE